MSARGRSRAGSRNTGPAHTSHEAGIERTLEVHCPVNRRHVLGTIRQDSSTTTASGALRFTGPADDPHRNLAWMCEQCDRQAQRTGERNASGQPKRHRATTSAEPYLRCLDAMSTHGPRYVRVQADATALAEKLDHILSGEQLEAAEQFSNRAARHTPQRPATTPLRPDASPRPPTRNSATSLVERLVAAVHARAGDTCTLCRDRAAGPADSAHYVHARATDATSDPLAAFDPSHSTCPKPAALVAVDRPSRDVATLIERWQQDETRAAAAAWQALEPPAETPRTREDRTTDPTDSGTRPVA